MPKNDANADNDANSRFGLNVVQEKKKKKGFPEKQGQLEQARKAHKFFGQEIKVSLHIRQSLPAQAGK